METLLAIVVGVFFATAIYLLMSSHLVRILIGVAILGNAVNLLIFTAGRLTAASPPLIEGSMNELAAGSANPLPQALILTAIVISFSIFSFLLVLTYRAFQELGTDDVNDMHVAEPVRPERPPMGY